MKNFYALYYSEAFKRYMIQYLEAKDFIDAAKECNSNNSVQLITDDYILIELLLIKLNSQD